MRRMRKSQPVGIIVLGLLLMLGIGSCDQMVDLLATASPESTTATGQAPPPTEPTAGPPPAVAEPASASREPADDRIVIGTFNIQVFGQAKMSQPDVMQYLVDIARRFDVLAIQEIRSLDQSLIPNFVDMINQNGAAYSYVLGPRQGYTVSKEQYAYLFNTRRIELLDPGYIVPDPEERFHRAPMASSFRYRGLPPGEAFSFILLNIHTDPDVSRQEVDALADAVMYVRQHHPYEDDVILVGDFNEPPRRFGRLLQVPHLVALMGDDTPTNTRGTRCLDNIVLDRYATAEFTGQAGVMDLMATYNLTLEQALRISDHMPVWAVFSAREVRGATAQQQRLQQMR